MIPAALARHNACAKPMRANELRSGIGDGYALPGEDTGLVRLLAARLASQSLRPPLAGAGLIFANELASRETIHASHNYCMQTFWQWLSQLQETYFTFDPKEYDELFDKELQKVIAGTSDPVHRQALESMRGFNWTGYVAAAVRNAGWRDQREIQERTHDIVAKLLIGKLFTGFDQRVSGPMDLRFRRSVGNAVRNMAELERNRKRLLPTIAIDQACEPGSVPSDDSGDEKVIKDFRRLVKRRLGNVGVAVLDVRLRGGETKSLVSRPDLGSPGKYVVKRAVQQLKELSREYAKRLGDPGFMRDIERAIGREQETVAKRLRTTTARQAVGA